MTYVQYSDDPIKKRVSKAFANLCDSSFGNKKSLKLIDKCFTIINQSLTEATFCSLQNFVYPVDTQVQINFEICAGETLSVFDNSLDDILLAPAPNPDIVTDPNYPFGPGTEYIPPSGEYGPSSVPAYYLLNNDKNYARGVLLYLTYPDIDKNGNDVLLANQGCTLRIYTIDQETNHLIDPDSNPYPYYEIPMMSFYAHFSNFETLSARNLINRLEIHNPSLSSCLTVYGMVIYTKSNSSAASCSC